MKDRIVIGLVALLISVSTVVLIVENIPEDSPGHVDTVNLDVGLVRTSLEYCNLDSDGELTVKKDLTAVDLSKSDKNVFGLDSPEVRIVPGSYFTADIQIVNRGSADFTYSIIITTSKQTTPLHEQLAVSVTNAAGHTSSAWLSELSDGTPLLVGNMSADMDICSFTVNVSFIGDEENNSAMGEHAEFDLLVSAVAE